VLSSWLASWRPGRGSLLRRVDGGGAGPYTPCSPPGRFRLRGCLSGPGDADQEEGVGNRLDLVLRLCLDGREASLVELHLGVTGAQKDQAREALHTHRGVCSVPVGAGAGACGGQGSAMDPD
jgi:hypothetical protein